jgi:hypothetical protein
MILRISLFVIFLLISAYAFALSNEPENDLIGQAQGLLLL